MIHPEEQRLNGDGATIKEVGIYFKRGFSLREKVGHPGYRKELLQMTFSSFLVNFLLHFRLYFHGRVPGGLLSLSSGIPPNDVPPNDVPAKTNHLW